MSILRLVQHFDSLGEVPAKLTSILQKVQEFVQDDIIHVNEVDEPFKELRAIYTKDRVPPHNGSAIVDTVHHRIAYSKHMPSEWKRLVVCKELMHVLDPEPFCTTTREQVVALASDLMPGGRHGAIRTNPRAFIEALAEFRAVALLFPYGLWENAVEMLKQNNLDIGKLTSELELPPEYVSLALSATWPQTRDTIIKVS